MSETPAVVAVCAGAEHGIRKRSCAGIRLIVARGVEGDAHFGEKVQHRSRAARDPELRNLRQVHLIHAELLAELYAKGFEMTPCSLGENITTRGLDLLALPTGTRLHFGAEFGTEFGGAEARGRAVVELTGLRNPCAQLDAVADGLMAATLERDASGELVRKAGVMGIVISEGTVRAGDLISVELPARSEPLIPV